MSGAASDAEALGHEREQYPDPEEYPLPDPEPMPEAAAAAAAEHGADQGGEDILDGSTPDADLQVEKADDA